MYPCSNEVSYVHGALLTGNCSGLVGLMVGVHYVCTPQGGSQHTTLQKLFMINFLAMLQVWHQQGDRLLIFMDMNKHILNGPLAKRMLGMGLEEAIHQNWGDTEPHTYVGGKEPIDAVFHTPDFKVTSFLQLSFHEGIGDHRTVLVDISTWSAIGKQEFWVVHPHAQRLNLKNDRARLKYLCHLEAQMATHKMTHHLEGECE
jgi:hypothetical protein